MFELRTCSSTVLWPYTRPTQLGELPSNPLTFSFSLSRQPQSPLPQNNSSSAVHFRFGNFAASSDVRLL